MNAKMDSCFYMQSMEQCASVIHDCQDNPSLFPTTQCPFPPIEITLPLFVYTFFFLLSLTNAHGEFLHRQPMKRMWVIGVCRSLCVSALLSRNIIGRYAAE